ncbi:unnamed protein product [Brassica oleracea]
MRYPLLRFCVCLFYIYLYMLLVFNCCIRHIPLILVLLSDGHIRKT